MNLIFIIDNKKVIGGGDYAQFKFAEFLAKRGNYVTIFAANWNEFLEDFSNLKNLKLNIRGELPRKIKGIGRINDLWNIIYTRLIVESTVKKKDNIDFIIGYLRESAIKTAKLGKKFNIKTVNFIFESPNWMKKQLGKRFLEEYKNRRFRSSWKRAEIAYKESAILFSNSELTRKECSKWLNKYIEGPIYPGLDIIEPETKVEEENQIIYIGRLNEYKNVNEIIEAVSKLKKSPKLVIIGSGEEEENLKELAIKLNVNYEFKGRVTDKIKWEEIKKSKFMVFPSSFEGFGMPPMEALACRKPCICSDIPILKEIYQDKVEYFKEHNIDDLAKKIKFLIDNPDYRKKRGNAGKKYVMKKYSWEKSAKKIEKILTEFLNKK